MKSQIEHKHSPNSSSIKVPISRRRKLWHRSRKWRPSSSLNQIEKINIVIIKDHEVNWKQRSSFFLTIQIILIEPCYTICRVWSICVFYTNNNSWYFHLINIAEEYYISYEIRGMGFIKLPHKIMGITINLIVMMKEGVYFLLWPSSIWSITDSREMSVNFRWRTSYLWKLFSEANMRIAFNYPEFHNFIEQKECESDWLWSYIDFVNIHWTYGVRKWTSIM